MQDDSKHGRKRKFSDVRNEASGSRQVNSSSNSPEIYWEDEQPRTSKQSNQDDTVNSSANFFLSSCSKQFIIEHYNELAQDIQKIMDIDELSDVTIAIDNQQFSAHKLILAARSIYFSGRFSGQGAAVSSSQKSDITLDNCSAQLFDLMLRYIYSGRMDLQEPDKETLDEVKDLMQAYGIDPSMQNDVAEQNIHDIEIDDEKIVWISDTIGEAQKETIDLVENIISINEENFFLAKDYSVNPPRICANYRCLQPDTLRQIYSFLKTQTKENDYSNTKSLAKDISKLLTGNIAPFDVTLTMRDTHFRAHKLILIARCPYFQ
ncbi:BTB/POZ domain-containing protein [Ditylenchus destructor]|uniref:BTB/POZ domain-containing protein n=1 Tax=Ditylenchus destructor TaxID=166010 RepID=A0AAD4R552_9BILA|nr:BTB/POZ domain-containing protein [Ditylenchus destructor]